MNRLNWISAIKIDSSRTPLIVGEFYKFAGETLQDFVQHGLKKFQLVERMPDDRWLVEDIAERVSTTLSREDVEKYFEIMTEQEVERYFAVTNLR